MDNTKPKVTQNTAQQNYRQTSDMRRTWEGNKIVDPSDVNGASPVSAAPTTSSFSTEHLASMDWAKTTARRDENHLMFGIWCGLYWILYGMFMFNGRYCSPLTSSQVIRSRQTIPTSHSLNLSIIYIWVKNSLAIQCMWNPQNDIHG